ncbi:PIN2/TERF1-interacting telomerase inhibitor 1 [Armadillidium nasatum]|uniref:PIN2/TERF1-interacting telomerase inhibitor 1 n=1 Tax=Armadillidium nasatum TaxID=96803 RepID=A0A5N5TI71_9CRUS|nr:PIN2/TERF1-interacting telomerase inhibitor 1 [Armadillidium nasatum]
MPMLAEPRKKSKLTLNPRGTLWANDENKFGQKLLEKMGWAKGKGLGKNEQGVKNPIRVSGNSDNKGMGFSGNPDLTTDHYENFEDVLASLNSANNSDSSDSESEKDSNNLKNIESLEMKSKNSRARVHYSKFTRGKDLSLYNENDLASVLGTKKILKRKRNNEMKNEEQNESIKEVINEETGEESDVKETFTYYSGNIKV